MTEKTDRPENVVRLVSALRDLAEEAGLQLTVITVSPSEKSAPPPNLQSELAEEQLRERKTQDLAWLHSHLTQQYGELQRLSGHYVAVRDKRILSVGDNSELVRLSAAKSIQVAPQEILVVPIAVRSSDAEYEWEETQHDLDLR